MAESRFQPPTLDDVAQAAGVSTATVSRCLNKSGAVSPVTHGRVMQAVKALGYTPNFSARALAARKTFTIGAIIPTMSNAIFARGLQAFQEALQAKGYTLVVSSSHYNPDNEAEQLRALVARGVDGVLLIGYARAPEVYETLRARGVPYVVAWAHSEDEEHPAVGFDNRRSMRGLAEAVLQLGHKKIAIVSGIREGNDRATDRVAGIHAALQAHGLDPAQVPLVETTYSIESGANAMQEILKTKPDITAVMCINDVLAVGAMQQAQDAGLDVPGDLSVTGFDDIDLAQLMRPRLTTVHVPHRQMGMRAAQNLIALIDGATQAQAHPLDTALRLRGSLGPA